MNRLQFMSELRRALSVLPEEEQANALRYYEEYFDDAGSEREKEAAAELGNPQKIAEQILADYRELTAIPAVAGNAGVGGVKAKKTRKGINPLLLVILVLLALPIGLPLAITFLALVLSIVAVGVVAVGIVGLVIALVPVIMILCGGAFTVFSFAVWGSPASALVTLGSGLGLIGAGVLLTLLLIKLCILFVPPIFRGFIAVLRWPINKIRGVRNEKNC